MLTFNNWYHWEWSDGRNGLLPPSSKLQSWVFKPLIQQEGTVSFELAVYDALQKIKAKNKSIVVMYSGGLDSEIILHAARLIGVDVTPAVIRFKDGLNDHDVHYVNRYFGRFGIKNPLYLDVDINKWLTDSFDHSYTDLRARYGFAHVATPLYFWARKKIQQMVGDCVVINGSGDLPLARIPDPYNILRCKPYVCVSLDSQQKRLMISSEQYPDDVPLFFVYTRQLVTSFINSDELRQFETNESKISITSLRRQLFTRTWPELEIRDKFTGFEKIKVAVFPVKSEYVNSMATYSNIEYARYKELLWV